MEEGAVGKYPRDSHIAVAVVVAAAEVEEVVAGAAVDAGAGYIPGHSFDKMVS
jgi:hypothetical protein